MTLLYFYSQSRYGEDDFFAFVNLRGEGNDVYHGPTCYTNYYNGASLAMKLGIEKVYFLNYDYIIKNDAYLDNVSSILKGQHNALLTIYLFIKFNNKFLKFKIIKK